MSEDPRCCGTGTCIINSDGICWCGQRWDGEKMCFPNADAVTAEKATECPTQLAQQVIRASADHET